MNGNTVLPSHLIVDDLEHIRIRPELFINTIHGYIWQEVAIYKILKFRK